MEKRSHSNWGRVSAMLREIIEVSIPCLVRLAAEGGQPRVAQRFLSAHI